MAYKNKTYVAFDASNNIISYNLMKAWKQNDGSTFNFYDAHDLNNIRPTSNEESIKRSLKERLKNTKVFVLLVGEKTKFHQKFVRWEIEQALKLDLPMIGVNLNGKRELDSDLCPALLRDTIALHVSFNAKIMEKALIEWGDIHYEKKKNNKQGSFCYSDHTYKSLGL